MHSDQTDPMKFISTQIPLLFRRPFPFLKYIDQAIDMFDQQLHAEEVRNYYAHAYEFAM